MKCKKDIEDLIEGIDEFDNKYITYRAQTLRTILTETLMYIEQKEQECENLASANKRLGADLCGQLQNHMRALDEIEKIANKQRKFDLTGKTPLTPVINEVGGDFIDILDIIDKVQGKLIIFNKILDN